MPSLSSAYDVCLLDLDGVVYIGADAAPHAPDALRVARAAGMRLAFVTNNASRPPEVVATHLRGLGVAANVQEVVTSAQAAARMLAERLPAGARVLVVGGAGLVDALRERGLAPVRSLADDPAAVVQGFDPTVDWSMLAEGSYAVADGLPWVASNADATIPTARGTAPGNGALVQVISMATGRYPEVAGKPEPPMHTETVLRTGARRPLVVGDRLDTDIEGANRSGVDSLLVLTGIATPATVAVARPRHRPTLIGPDLRALAARTDAIAVEPGRTTYGRWTVTIQAGRLEIAASGDATPPDQTPWPPQVQDRLDGLRALCGALWAAAQTGEDDGVGDAEGVAAALGVIGW